MANSKVLREVHTGLAPLNKDSKTHEMTLTDVISSILSKKKFDVSISWDSKIHVNEIVSLLKKRDKNTKYSFRLEKSFLKPDGGILYIRDSYNNKFPILITEMKQQGTNSLRIKEGKNTQAKGNAIERLGKNVIGFKELCGNDIFPFVAFISGCDFVDSSTIVDRVRTIARFQELNKLNFNAGSFFLKETSFSYEEMEKVLTRVIRKSISYYKNKVKNLV